MELMKSTIHIHDGTLHLFQIFQFRLHVDFVMLTPANPQRISDFAGEMLHLSATAQFSCFSAVVGSMWSVVDVDCPVLAAGV